MRGGEARMTPEEQRGAARAGGHSRTTSARDIDTNEHTGGEGRMTRIGWARVRISITGIISIIIVAGASSALAQEPGRLDPTPEERRIWQAEVDGQISSRIRYHGESCRKALWVSQRSPRIKSVYTWLAEGWIHGVIWGYAMGFDRLDEIVTSFNELQLSAATLS